MSANLLHYRPWRGNFQPPAFSPWPIARIALGMMFRRKLFWVLYAFGLLTFLVFFFGQYLLAWAGAQAAGERVNVIGVSVEADKLTGLLRNILRLDGKANNYRDFFNYQGYMVMIVLALAGTIIVGNDFQFGSLPFYLSKPLSPWHYLLGKCLAVAVFVNMVTTLPALVLFFQYRALYDWEFLPSELRLLFGIIGYGLTLTVFLSLMLVAIASWLRQTVPLIMAWTTLFLFLRLLATSLVTGLDWNINWRLIDLWNDTYVVGCALLGAEAGYNPAWQFAALILAVGSLICFVYLSLRVRAVEVVR
jgi:ABC-type transport system involved in multi-copper enzyme maturation permease subunit